MLFDIFTQFLVWEEEWDHVNEKWERWWVVPIVLKVQFNVKHSTLDPKELYM